MLSSKPETPLSAPIKIWYQSYVDPVEQSGYIQHLQAYLDSIADLGVTYHVQGITPPRSLSPSADGVPLRRPGYLQRLGSRKTRL